jgi:hypothetical protein
MVPSAANGVKRTVLGDANTDDIPSEALDGDLQSMLRMDAGDQIASRQPAIGAGRDSLRRNGLSRILLAWNAVAEKRKRVTRLAASDKLNASTLSAQPSFRSVTGEAALENTSSTERERKRARLLTSGEPHGPTLNAKSEICSVTGEIADPSTPTMDSIEMESRLTTADILYVPAQELQPVLSSVLGAAADEKTAVVESEGKKLSLAPVDIVDAVLTPTPLREFCLATGAATDEIATPVSFLVLRDEWTRLLRRRSRKVAKAAQAAYRSPERRPLSPINLSWLATIANGNETGNVELADLDGRVASFSAAEFTSPCRDLWAAAEAVDVLTAPEQEDILYVKVCRASASKRVSDYCDAQADVVLQFTLKQGA